MNNNTTMRREIANSRPEFERLVKVAYKHLTPAGASRPEFWYRGHDRGVYTLTPSLFRYEDSEMKEQEMFQICDQYVMNPKHAPEYGPDFWSKVSWMQHYGIPTRLVDWTTELHIAEFFAVKFLLSQKGKDELRNRAPHEMPCIYVLNPLLLNGKSNIMKVPTVPAKNDPDIDFEKRFTETATAPLVFPLAVAPRPNKANKRQYAQFGRFTVQGSNPDPLEIQIPNCVFCIQLSIELCNHFLENPHRIDYDALQLFPDREGVAQFVASKARLKLIPYDQRLAGQIRMRLKERQVSSMKRIDSTGKKMHSSLYGTCNFGSVYIRRPKEARQLVSNLVKTKASQFIFVTGEAGIGKTNFVLETLLYHKKLKERVSLFVPLRLFGSSSETTTPRRNNSRLLPELYEVMIGAKSTVQEQETARQMIREGEVIVVLDGLDELARNRGQETVKNVIFELEALIAGSEKARIIVSCRDHIFVRLQETGSLGRFGHKKPVEIKPFDRETVENALQKEFRGDLAQLSQSSHSAQLTALALLAETPLLYQMIRSARKHLSELLEVCESMPTSPDQETVERYRTDLQKVWFEVMLKNRREEKDGFDKLEVIAGDMLKRRSDLVEVRNGGKTAKDLALLIRKLSKPPFVLFTGEKQRSAYAFSHQSLREFVLARSVYQEIRFDKYKLLTSSPSFDYEGGEFYARVHDLFGIEPNLDKYIIQRLDSLLRNPGSLCEEQWNHLVRNLFEMLGELLPDDNSIAEKATMVALKYLNPMPNAPRYVSFKTRYNVARCLERIHDSAPRPYFRHTLQFHSTWPKAPSDNRHVGAYAIRGFHLLKQESRPVPPMVFNVNTRQRGLRHLEIKVSKALISAILDLKVPELFEDAAFLGVNCTHALIRWLPRTPDLGQIRKLLGHHNTSNPMKQNIFWALYRMYGTKIPPCFRKQGFFKDCGPLSCYHDKSWASEKAKKMYEKLLLEDSQVEQATAKVRL